MAGQMFPGEGVVPSIVFGQDLVFTSSGYGSPTVRAIRPDGHGEVTATHIAWESRDNVPLISSFVVADGLLFCIKESGVATCLDVLTGKVIWQQRLGGKQGASPVLAEGRLYCLAKDGSTTVIAADREFKQLARNSLEGPCEASPAISTGRIFFRSQSALFCIRNLRPDRLPEDPLRPLCRLAVKSRKQQSTWLLRSGLPSELRPGTD